MHLCVSLGFYAFQGVLSVLHIICVLYKVAILFVVLERETCLHVMVMPIYFIFSSHHLPFQYIQYFHPGIIARGTCYYDRMSVL